MILTNPDDQLTGSLCQERSKSCAEKMKKAAGPKGPKGKWVRWLDPFPVWIHLPSIIQLTQKKMTCRSFVYPYFTA